VFNFCSLMLKLYRSILAARSKTHRDKLDIAYDDFSIVLVTRNAGWVNRDKTQKTDVRLHGHKHRLSLQDRRGYGLSGDVNDLHCNRAPLNADAPDQLNLVELPEEHSKMRLPFRPCTASAGHAR
jgi:hypothetical protein